MAMLVLHLLSIESLTDPAGPSPPAYHPRGRNGCRQDAEGWTFSPPLGTLQASVRCRPYQQGLRL